MIEPGTVQYQSQRPPRPQRFTLYVATVGGGNTLTSGQDGIKVPSANVTSVPTAYDPSASPACVDGIGYGTLIIQNSVLESVTDILIVLDGRSPLGDDTYGFDLLVGDKIAVHPDPLAIPVSGGGTIYAYVPIWF